MDKQNFDPLADMQPRWLVRPLVWLANKMSGPLFIVEFVLFLIVWMSINTLTIIRFDGWPFMGLNLFMSALASIQGAVIGVKQTLSDYKRDYAEQQHQEKIDHVIMHIEQMETEILATIKGGDGTCHSQ